MIISCERCFFHKKEEGREKSGTEIVRMLVCVCACVSVSVFEYVSEKETVREFLPVDCVNASHRHTLFN